MTLPDPVPAPGIPLTECCPERREPPPWGSLPLVFYDNTTGRLKHD